MTSWLARIAAVSAITLGVPAMSQTVDEQIKELGERKKLIDAQKDLTASEKALLTEQIGFESQKLAAQNADSARIEAEAKAKKAVSEAQEQAAKARSAEIAADVAAKSAAIGVVAATSQTGGSVTVSDKSPPMGDAVLLQAKALRSAADKVALVVQDKAGKPQPKAVPTIVLIEGRTLPSYPELDRRSLQVQALHLAVRSLEKVHAQLSGQGETIVSGAPAGGPNTESLAVVGSLLSSVAGIASYFKTDYEYMSGATAGSTPELMTAVAGALARDGYAVVEADGSPNPRALGQVRSVLDQLGQSQGIVDDLATKLRATKRLLEGVKPSNDDAKKQQITSLIAEIDQFQTSVTAWGTERKAFVDGLLGQSAADTLPKLVGEVSRHLNMGGTFGPSFERTFPAQDRRWFLAVKSLQEVSSGFSKKNIWTTLGGSMPYWVSGGVTMSYALFDSSPALRSAAVLPVHGGFERVTDVPAMVR